MEVLRVRQTGMAGELSPIGLILGSPAEEGVGDGLEEEEGHMWAPIIGTGVM
jgi:hypothetical protein